MRRSLCALALLAATAAHAVQQRDLDADGLADAVYDESTGLSWMADASALQGSWVYATELAPKDGWFLPCVAEMRTLLHGSLGLPEGGFYGGEAEPFRGLVGGVYWTSDGFQDPEWGYTWSAYSMHEDSAGALFLGDTAKVWLARIGDVGEEALLVSPAPEPTTWALMAIGLALISGLRRQHLLPRARQQSCQAL